MIVNDLELTIPFRIFDTTTGHYIFNIPDDGTPGDTPPDVALLPAISMVVDHRTGWTEIEVIGGGANND